MFFVNTQQWRKQMKNITISEELFIDLIRYFFAKNYNLENKIKQQLYDKNKRIAARKHYNDYKHSPTLELREAAKLKYIELKNTEDYKDYE